MARTTYESAVADLPYAILRDGRVVLSSNVRTQVIRLSRTATFLGTPCQYLFGEWRPLGR